MCVYGGVAKSIRSLNVDSRKQTHVYQLDTRATPQTHDRPCCSVALLPSFLNLNPLGFGEFGFIILRKIRVNNS